VPHTKPHVPLVQVAVPLVTLAHAVAQLPQWFGSVIGSTQLALHSNGVGAVHDAAQLYVVPFKRQSGVGDEHIVVHDPHVAGAERSASHPSAAIPLQSA
jgi:hypothetical protein